MRQDWIEFEGWNFGKFMVRPEYVDWVSSHKEFSTKENKDIYYTSIHVDDGSDYGENMYTPEPYEQVKQKIIDAEKVDLSDVVQREKIFVEHFTREEYEFLKRWTDGAIMNDEAVFTDEALAEDEDYKMVKKIRDKLNEILKEDK